jgi:hypothetical protein
MPKLDIDNMVKTGCFVSVHVRRPSLRTQLSWKELGLKDIEGLASAPSALPPSGMFNDFQKYDQRMRTILRNHTSGSEHGFRFMKSTQWDAFYAQVEPVRQQYLDLIEPFLKEWDQHVGDALRLWDTKAAETWYSLKDPDVERDVFVQRVLQKLQRAWPTADELRDRFGAEVKVMYFTVPGEDQFTNAGMAALARQNARQTLNDFFVEAQGELRMRAVEKLQRIREVLKKGETVTERSLKPLRQFVEQFEELSLVPDKSFKNALDNVVNEVERLGGAKGLRTNRAAWSSFGDLVEETTTLGERLAQEALNRKLDLSERKIQL